jgi:hypothetical protein
MTYYKRIKLNGVRVYARVLRCYAPISEAKHVLGWEEKEKTLDFVLFHLTISIHFWQDAFQVAGVRAI